MRFRVEFEVEDGDCELYKKFNPKDSDSACKTCPLGIGGAKYCMDLDMHKAKVISSEVID